jgi:surface polysaccharide O-acyltransferase-like enzyme
MQSAANRTANRRHDLDWLRVAAFGMLILYHIGMYFVTWDWHVKSRHASPSLEPLMAIVNPWRLPLLFLISGVALRYAMDAKPLAPFLLRRVRKLLLPLVFGMAVVVAPQAYVELRVKGEIPPGYLAFHERYLSFDPSFSIIVPTWNHLWYVAYVLVYTLAVAALLPVLRMAERNAGASMSAALASPRFRSAALWLPVLPFLAYRAWLDPAFPTTHALVDDWATHAHALTFVLVGWFAAKSPAFWAAVRGAWPSTLAIALALAALVFLARMNWSWVRGDEVLAAGVAAARTVYAWAAILALMGLAARWFDRGGPVLDYLRDAVFPFYILHQTIIVAMGYALLGAGLSAWLEGVILVASTAAGCWLAYEYVIRRSGPLRPLFGLEHEPRVRSGRMASERQSG